jgi:Outer membrane protein beta-barrel domain
MKKFIVILLLLLLCGAAFAQQDYVSRFDTFGGYSYFTSPKLNLTERGFNGEVGWNVKRWVALGFDFSILRGHSSLLPSELNPTVQAQLAPIFATLPPGTVISVPYNAQTETYSAGPQINIRHWKPVTLFVRPALGALHETVTAKPNSALTGLLVNSLIGPSGKVTDTAVFYGFGGGIDWNVSRHFAVRTGADFVHFTVFKSLLNGGRNSVRVSVGPAVRWGGDVR